MTLGKATPGVYDLEERSDIDPHSSRIHPDQLGEDWGEGFFVEPELVKVDRGPDGRVVRTTPLSQYLDRHEVDLVPPVVTEPHKELVARTPAARDALVIALADRLMEYYIQLGPQPHLYNPVYDGIPDLPLHADENLKPLPGTKLYPASEGQVFSWLCKIIGKRASLVNTKLGLAGELPDLADTLRITRSTKGGLD